MLQRSKHIYLFPLIIVCFFYSVDKSVLQSAVDGGLIIGGFVNYPENFKNITSSSHNVYSTLIYFSLILLKLNFSVDTISIIFVFVILLFYTLGIFYLTLGITKSKNLALLLSLITILFRENFGLVDYEVNFFSEHTFGNFSNSAFTLIVGLLANKNFKVAGLIIGILLSSHLFVGIWVLAILIVIYLIDILFLSQKDKINTVAFREIFFGFSIWLVPMIISLIFYFNNTIENSFYILDDFYTYMEFWDYHRNIYLINYDYVLKTLILIILVLIYVYYFNLKENLILIFFILLTCIGSFFVYIFFKIVPNQYIPQFLINSMPTRVFGLHSVLGYPLIVSILFLIFKKLTFKIVPKLQKFKFIFTLVLIVPILILPLVTNNFFVKAELLYVKKIEPRFIKFINTLSFKKMNDEDFFWKKIKQIDSSGYFVTTFHSSSPTLRRGRKPYILNSSFIDSIPYFPYQVTEFKLIIENIYGISFINPPKLYTAALYDKWFKETFEKRSIDEWNKIAEKYNLSGVIVPSNWNLLIKNKIVSQKFTAYLIN